jgi:hypothetical protein
MKTLARLLLISAFISTSCLSVSARKKAGARKPPSEHKCSTAEIEAATRLQVFLDRANFSPGIIDGRYSDFTLKALALYRESRGEASAPVPKNAETAPDLKGLDLATIGPVLVSYSVADADFQNIGPLPSSISEQAKLKSLPYRDATEAVAEKFHCDPKFLEELNPGKTLKPATSFRCRTLSHSTLQQ